MAQDSKGFTLVELMITLAMTGIIIAAVYSTYNVQQRAYSKQEQIMEVQQTLRVALYIMSQEIRMAGFSPKNSGVAAIAKAEATTIAFSMDSNGDGSIDTGEEIKYTIEKNILRRNKQPLANNIEHIEFLYTLKGGASSLTPSNTNDIRTVTISILGRATNLDGSFSDTNTYKSASGADWTPKTAKEKRYRRQLFTTIVQCRNMGL